MGSKFPNEKKKKRVQHMEKTCMTKHVVLVELWRGGLSVCVFFSPALIRHLVFQNSPLHFQTSMCVDVCVCMCVCACVYVHMRCVNACICRCVCVMCVFVCVCVCVCVQVFVCTCVKEITISISVSSTNDKHNMYRE